MSWTLRLVVMGSLLAWGCAQGENEPAAGEPAEAELTRAAPESLRAASGAPVLATLHTKDSELIISGQGGDVRYSLLDASGQRRDNLSLEELLAYDKNLYEVVKFATARGKLGAAASGPFMDARHDAPSTSPGRLRQDVSLDSRIDALRANPALSPQRGTGH